MSLVYLRSYSTEKGRMVAACDEECMGKTFREGRLKLSLETGFYGDALVALGEALMFLEGAEILNLVGPNIVEGAIARGLVHPDAVISIGGIPHAQVMKL